MDSTQNSGELLSIIELGGYPDFSTIYRQHGFKPVMVNSMRKAIRQLKNTAPAVVVAEFNYQTDFRDRTSSLESLMAVLQRLPDTQVIIFYEEHFRPQLQRVLDRFPVLAILPFPVDTEKLHAVLSEIVMRSE